METLHAALPLLELQCKSVKKFEHKYYDRFIESSLCKLHNLQYCYKLYIYILIKAIYKPTGERIFIILAIML